MQTKPKYSNGRIYYTFNYPNAAEGSKTLLTGIRGVNDSPGQVYISGFFVQDTASEPQAFVYRGDILGEGNWYDLTYPSSNGNTVNGTALYGPNNGKKDNTIQVVGNYTTVENGTTTLGCLYQGKLNGHGKWTTIIPTSTEQVINIIAHSTMGGLVVGNYDTVLYEGKAFIYDINANIYYNITNPYTQSITAYGIWQNDDNSYTICGGYTSVNTGLNAGEGNVNMAYLVDWDNKKKKLFNWRSYAFNDDPLKAFMTHFDGITTDGKGGYNLTGTWTGIDKGERKFGFFCNVNKYNKAKWESVSYPKQVITTGNSIWRDAVIGVYTSSKTDGVNGYVSLSE